MFPMGRDSASPVTPMQKHADSEEGVPYSMNFHKGLKTLFTLVSLSTLAMMLMATSCYFESANSGSVGANVPYFMQEGTYYCGAAVVQMIAKWSGRDVSQTELFVFMNGDPNWGIHFEDLVRGVRNYTSLTDAGLDNGGRNDNNYFARQISSVSNQMPVAAVIDNGIHSVVLYFGSWHQTVDANNHHTYFWDSVTYHDPARGAAQVRSATDWSYIHCSDPSWGCVQIVSASGAAAGPRTLADYNPEVYFGGGDDRPPHGPYAY